MGAETPTPGAALLEMDDPRRGRLVIRAGETVVLLGPSGAGKTALIRALLGLEGAHPGPVLAVRGRAAPTRELAALVADGRLMAQAPLAELLDSTDPDIRAVLAWVVA